VARASNKVNRQVPFLRFSASDQKCDREKSGARHNDNKDENDRAPDILSFATARICSRGVSVIVTQIKLRMEKAKAS